LHRLGDAQVGQGAHDFHSERPADGEAFHKFRRAIQRSDINQDQLEGWAGVLEQAGQAELGVLQLAAARDQDRDQARGRGHRQRLLLQQLLGARRRFAQGLGIGLLAHGALSFSCRSMPRGAGPQPAFSAWNGRHPNQQRATAGLLPGTTSAKISLNVPNFFQLFWRWPEAAGRPPQQRPAQGAAEK
jgi:hypothetical protein